MQIGYKLKSNLPGAKEGMVLLSRLMNLQSNATLENIQPHVNGAI